MLDKDFKTMIEPFPRQGTTDLEFIDAMRRIRPAAILI